jgi:hypothetical protein
MVGTLEHATLRYIAFANHLMILISSIIVTGLASWFLAKYDYRGVDIVYQEVIVCLTLALLINIASSSCKLIISPSRLSSLWVSGSLAQSFL